MKRNLLFMSVLASLFMAGCSQDDIALDEGANGNGEANTSYLAVNLVSSDATLSRAASGFEDGSTAENKVTKVRFYFFNGIGGAVNVKLQGTSKVNYYDWTPVAGDQSNDASDKDDIESKLKATIVINTSKGDEIPQRIAAVLNPPTIDGEPLLPNSSLSLSVLKGKVADFATTGENGLTSEGKFVMFNSVGGKGEEFSTTLIEAKNLCKSESEALAAPVTIYVERSVAKVRVILDDGLGYSDNKLALTDKDGKALSIGGEQVYLKLEGWGLTAETSEGRLVKKVNSKWETEDPWYEDHRSFWAINSLSATNVYHTYNHISKAVGKNNALYTNENAQQSDVDGTAGKAEKHTKFMLKGTLCKENGEAFTIVRHLGVYFADDANLTGLKGSILNQLDASGKKYYYEFVESGETKRAQIGVDDLKIVVVEPVEEEESKNNCYVCAQLTDAAAGKTWYRTPEEEDAIENAAEEINGVLKFKKGENVENDVDKALVWNSGMTYYYSDIKHLNNNIGVVRNHIYDINVTKIAGLGTPVYDPAEVIYPEKPEDNDHFIAAEIKILSWRVVENDYELNW